MKKKAFKYFNSAKSVKEYSDIYYKKLRLDLNYPADYKRLMIFIKLLKKHKPKKIVDAGCGTGMPLIKIKKKGFNITGYDKSENMIKISKKHLKNNKLPSNLTFKDDFENPKVVKNNSVDCILGMGAFYYSKNFTKTILQQKNKLKKNGRMIFSMRNKLFNISTFNTYSINFFNELYEANKIKRDLKHKYTNLFKKFDNRKKISLKNIDDENVHTITHNPLTIRKELFLLGLECEDIYFYHYHALPPIFESFNKMYFRKKSWEMENANDWRGYLIASGFIVDCKKI